MIEKYLRDYYQKHLVEPVLKHCHGVITPLQITLSGAIVGVLVLPLLALNFPLLAIFMLLLSGYFDTLDGTLARHLGDESNWGCIVDITCDRVVETAVIFGLFSIDSHSRGLACLCILGSVLFCVTSFLVIGIFKEENPGKKSFFYHVGLIERAEAFAFFIAMILLPAHFATLAYSFSGLVVLSGVLHLVSYHY